MTDDAPQQTYLASPDHSLHDILTVIAPIGIAVPGDGDFIARHRTQQKAPESGAFVD